MLPIPEVCLKNTRTKNLFSIGIKSLSKAARSRVYFYSGIKYHDLGEYDLSVDRFRKSIATFPLNLLAYGGLFATWLLGERAVIFYKLKRKLLGVH
jgi:hypothetical protein